MRAVHGPEFERRVREVFVDLVDEEPSSWPSRLERLELDDATRDRVSTLLAWEARLRGSSGDSTISGLQTPEPVSERLPDRVEEFEIVREIGCGGMGVVYLARDTMLDRHVALKIVARHLASSGSGATRFHREARAAARLRHDHIVQVHRLGEVEGAPFIVMEYVEGATLAGAIRDEHATYDRPVRLRWIAQIASALDHAHASGVVHRDIKPSNILITNAGAAKLSDFGLAELVDGAGHVSMSTTLMGSLRYMSPEQLDEAEQTPDHRADIFSLGIVMYEALTGRHPFEATSTAGVLRNIVDGRFEPPSAFLPDGPDGLDDVCARALALNPDDRYRSAEEFRLDVERLLAGEAVERARVRREDGATRRAVL
ncbi:MAG: hypothetical protein CMJ31_13895, partial [Phycisphaerae bacterium]|nr:hypothetical protein [Phycisphaerae bacterium]